MEATALAQPDTEGEFVLDTDASGVAISSILHQWQGPPESRKLQTDCIRKQKVDLYTGHVWSPEAGKVRCILFHLEEPQLSLSTEIHTEGRQSGPLMAKNIFDGPGDHWSMDRGSRKVSFQH